MRKYIREFYEAQVITETLNYQHTESTDDATYGTVYVHRATSDNASDNRQNLTYVPYDDMVAYRDNNDSTALNYFSVDEEGNLVIAGTTQTIVETGDAEDNLNEQSNETVVTLRTVDYKTAVSKYSTQMTFLVDLVLISQNPEFVSALVDLIKDSRIEITVMDTVSTSENIETYTYTPKRKWAEETGNVTISGQQQTVVAEEEGDPVTEITKTTTINTNPTFNITYVKTWFSEQEITYNKKTDGPTTNTTTEGPIDEPEPAGSEGEWKINQITTTQMTRTTETYEEGTRGDVTLTIGEKGDGKKYEEGTISEPTFVGLMETAFKIPNSETYEEAGSNLVSGADLLLELLQSDQKLQNMEIIMRYALNEYTSSNSYGSVSLDDLLTTLEVRMTRVGTGYIVDTRQSDPEIVILDPDTLKSAIEATYSGQTRTNLVNEVSSFLEMQDTYNVNAVFAIAVTIIESSGGTNWAAISSETYNWMSVTGSYNGQSYKNPNSSNERTWRVYPSFEEAVLDFGDLIANSSYYFQNGKYTVSEIAPTYCNQEWGTKVASEMTKIFKAAGIDVSNITITEGGITTQEEAEALQQQIENEWIHTQTHNNSAYQSGPFEKWWSSPYNTLSPFQCTWWANGRASMYLETYGTSYTKYPTQSGNGQEYYFINQSNGWFEYGNTPRPNSIVSWTYGQYGHVAYVEGVAEDGIYISHAGNGTSWFGIQKIPLDGSIWNYGTPDGYIYLDSPK